MPYIEQQRQEVVGPCSIENPTNAGELNYQITCLLIEYLYQHGTNYQHINDCLGALEGAKLEFYRRVAVPYEDGKITLNGDVY